MAAEALPAIKARQIASIDRLLNEIKETDWRTPVPPELATALATASLAGHRHPPGPSVQREEVSPACGHQSSVKYSGPA